MKTILIEGMKTNKKIWRTFKCNNGCGCVWKSNEYKIRLFMGMKYKVDDCPECRRDGTHIKSRKKV